MYNRPEEFNKILPNKRKVLFNLLFKEASQFFSFYSSNIEIMRAGHLEKVYFIKPPYSEDLQGYD